HQVGGGDDRGHLDQGVAPQVQTGHFAVDPYQPALALRHPDEVIRRLRWGDEDVTPEEIACPLCWTSPRSRKSSGPAPRTGRAARGSSPARSGSRTSRPLPSSSTGWLRAARNSTIAPT